MKYETLSAWELLALQASVEAAVDTGQIDRNGGSILLGKITCADTARLGYSSSIYRKVEG